MSEIQGTNMTNININIGHQIRNLYAETYQCHLYRSHAQPCELLKKTAHGQSSIEWNAMGKAKNLEQFDKGHIVGALPGWCHDCEDRTNLFLER